MYTGRFAPTPSGYLHLGSLFTAAGAYLQARSQHGLCLLRLEDLDRPRCLQEYSDSILADLSTLGFVFDKAHDATQADGVRVQSADTGRYEKALSYLLQTGKAYVCHCTRRQLKERPCPCQALHLPYEPGRPGQSVRFAGSRPEFHTVLRRSDGIFAYNLACVCDDICEGITQIVRGRDLLEVTPMQQELFAALLPAPCLSGQLSAACIPDFVHLPLLMADTQHKLSKQNHAPAVRELFASAQAALLYVLRLLGQDIGFAFKYGAGAALYSLPDREFLQCCAACTVSPQHILQQAALTFDLSSVPAHNLQIRL